jgi:hypothetical protein
VIGDDEGQASLSAGITGLDTHMILEPRLQRIPASKPDIRSSTSHHAGMPKPWARSTVFW